MAHRIRVGCSYLVYIHTYIHTYIHIHTRCYAFLMYVSCAYLTYVCMYVCMYVSCAYLTPRYGGTGRDRVPVGCCYAFVMYVFVSV
jgi:hypothetical protein